MWDGQWFRFDLTATTSTLSFNFSGSDIGYLDFISNGNSLSFDSVGSGACAPDNSGCIKVALTNDNTYIVPVTGSDPIGIVAATPLPSSWALMFSILAAFGFLWHRKAKSGLGYSSEKFPA